jgi:hypothetical protein
MRNICKVLVGKPRSGSEDVIERGVKEIGCEDMDWIQHKITEGSSEEGNETARFIKCNTFLDCLCDCQLIKKN